MNETLATIFNRRSVRQFTDESVKPEDIRTILEAANAAPSAHNEQSWRFIVVTGEKKVGLANLITSRAPSFARPSSALLRMAARSIMSAPVVIAVANSGALIKRGPALFENQEASAVDFFRTMEIQSSAAAVQNMLLAAVSLNLATVWLGILFLIKDEVLEYLGEPEGEFMAVVPMGYAVRTQSSPKKKALEITVKTLNQ